MAKTATKKHAGGRPSEYKAAYCKEVRDYMGSGYSLTAFAGKIGVSRDTVYEWEKTKPEFSDAIKRARAGRVNCLENRLLTGEGDVAPTIFALKNACPDEWRKEPAVEVTLHNEVAVDLSKPPEDWGQKEIEAALRKSGGLEAITGSLNGHPEKKGVKR